MLIVIPRKWLSAVLSVLSLGAFSKLTAETASFRWRGIGGTDGFLQIQRIHGAAIRKFASRRIPESDVDDVIQETWLALWQNLEGRVGRVQVRELAFTICYRKIQDYWRRSYARNGGMSSPIREQMHAYVPREFEQVELRDSIERFWSRCSPDQQEILAMYYGDGLTLKDIARVRRRNLNTIKYQFYRAHEVAAAELPELETMIVRKCS